MSTPLADTVAALKWVWDIAEMQPFNASLDETNQVSTWKCWGCGGQFESRWPQWIEPTDETFPHEPKCRYVTARNIVAED